uniref:hypothetical protein n=1 Tax=Acinetobacter calcoaceticus TaxID=471 RepID=UPI003008897E
KFLLYINEIKMPSLFFKQIKGIAKPIKTVLGTSKVLLLIKFFGRDDLKSEKPSDFQTALNV